MSKQYNNAELNNIVLIPEYEQSKYKQMTSNNINQYETSPNKMIIKNGESVCLINYFLCLPFIFLSLGLYFVINISC